MLLDNLANPNRGRQAVEAEYRSMTAVSCEITWQRNTYFLLDKQINYQDDVLAYFFPVTHPHDVLSAFNLLKNIVRKRKFKILKRKHYAYAKLAEPSLEEDD